LSLQLTVDIKELYRQLCLKYKRKSIKLVRIMPDEEAVRKTLES
jgi:hypothetical protein